LDLPLFKLQDVSRQSNYALPMDLRYFADFLNPIFFAFISTDANDRLSFAATLGPLVTGNIFLSTPTSTFDHSPLVSFFFAISVPFIFEIVSVLTTFA